MERIRVFKVLKGLAMFFIIFGTIFTILGFSLFIKSLISGFNTKFPSGDWNSVIFTLEGPLFILMGYLNLKNKKYYIEWDDKELRFLLPDTKQVETILFSEIDSVKIKLFEIELKLTDSVRTLNLDNLEFEDLKRVKKKFEDLSLTNK
jgi:hypothetical protein